MKGDKYEILTPTELASFSDIDMTVLLWLIDKRMLPEPVIRGEKIGWDRSTVEWMQKLDWSKIQLY